MVCAFTCARVSPESSCSFITSQGKGSHWRQRSGDRFSLDDGTAHALTECPCVRDCCLTVRGLGDSLCKQETMPEGKSPGGTCPPVTAVMKTGGITSRDKPVCRYHDVSCATSKATILFHRPGTQPPAIFCPSQIATLEATCIFYLKMTCCLTTCYLTSVKKNDWVVSASTNQSMQLQMDTRTNPACVITLPIFNLSEAFGRHFKFQICNQHLLL